VRLPSIDLTMAVLVLAGLAPCLLKADEGPAAVLRVGWATTDSTPPKPVSVVGFFEKRISDGVRDPLTATALALESPGATGRTAEQAILISCDLLWIRKTTQEAVRKALKEQLPDFDSDKVILNATHTRLFAHGPGAPRRRL